MLPKDVCDTPLALGPKSEPETQDAKPSTLDPKPETLNPNPGTRNPKAEELKPTMEAGGAGAFLLLYYSQA